MKKPLLTFECHNLRTGHHKIIRAHYLTTAQHVTFDQNETNFWVRRGWFRIDECVGILVGDYWQISTGESDQDVARELGVKL